MADTAINIELYKSLFKGRTDIYVVDWENESWRDEYLKWICGFENAKRLMGLSKAAVAKDIKENKKEAINYINEKLTELKISIDYA